MLRGHSIWPVIGTSVVLMFGCAQDVSSPRDLATPAGVTVSPNETVHGTLAVTGPGQAGVQGSVDPFLTGDDGTAYALELGTGLDALRDPASSGRGVTLTGDLLTRDPVPVGANARTIIVSGFQFDSD
jgi:hypothetical protein